MSPDDDPLSKDRNASRLLIFGFLYRLWFCYILCYRSAIMSVNLLLTINSFW